MPVEVVARGAVHRPHRLMGRVSRLALDGFEVNRLQVVAARVQDEGGEIAIAVVGSQRGRAVVRRALGERGPMERLDLLAGGGPECQMETAGIG